MIIVIYGLLALPVLLYFIPSMVEIPYIAEYFCVSFACYVVHTTIDVTAKPPRRIQHLRGIREDIHLHLYGDRTAVSADISDLSAETKGLTPAPPQVPRALYNESMRINIETSLKEDRHVRRR
jgi:hypothetical protein